MRQLVPCLAASVLVGMLSVPGSAATLRGTVRDPSGAVLSGANVKVRHEGTGVARSASTNTAGIFSFADLNVGSYQVEVASAGFKTSAFHGIALDVADAKAVDVVLQIGDVAEEVVVDGSGLAVQTIGGDVAGLVNGE